jgi:hypothetical protein
VLEIPNFEDCWISRVKRKIRCCLFLGEEDNIRGVSLMAGTGQGLMLPCAHLILMGPSVHFLLTHFLWMRKLKLREKKNDLV